MRGWKERAQERRTRYAQYFSAHLSEEGLHDAVDLYASPFGQRLVLAPDTVSPADRRQWGQIILAHPPMNNVSTAMIEVAAIEHQMVDKQKLMLAQKFQEKLCTHLRLDHISAAICEPGNVIR